MDKKNKINKKRVARSEVIFDEDDLYLLFRISKASFIDLKDVKEFMNFTHRSLLIHLRRLHKHSYLNWYIMDGMPTRAKVVAITDKGRNILKELMKSEDIMVKLRKYSNV